MSRSTRTTSLRSSTTARPAGSAASSCGQFAEAVRFEPTAQRQHHVAICLALDLQH